jgi:SAM-dependent methyltransferase
MYSALATYCRLINPPEDYAQEAVNWRNIVSKRLGAGRHKILELGVGGGSNMSHLTNDFEFTAVDIAPAMIEQARALNPLVELHIGDMRTVRLGRRFDAVFIHDAISYMLTEDDLRATFGTAAAHLEDGGILVVAPDWLRETFRDPFVNTWTNTGGEIELTGIEYTYDADPSDAMYETLMWYLIRRRGGAPQVEQDRHTFGLFSLATWERLIIEAGFRLEKVTCDTHQEGQPGYLLTGVRQR